MDKKIEMLPTGSIKPYEKNPRKNDSAVDAVANSIREFGFKQPIVVDKDMVIIVGHTRWKAAKKLGLKEVPVIVADDLSEEKAKAYRIADNSTGEIAEWDYDLLGEELKDIDIDMSLFGLDEEEDKTIVMEELQDPPVREVENPITKPGDIWILGRHRIICGDSTNSEDMNRLMQGEEADLIMTDPPYNVGYTGHIKERDKIANDSMQDEEYVQFLKNAISVMELHLRRGGGILHLARNHGDKTGYGISGRVTNDS